MIFRRIGLSCLLVLSALNAFAIAPILPSLNEPFPNPIFVSGGSYTIIYSFKNQLPFTLIKPLVIEKQASPAAEFSYIDECTDKKLAPYEVCTVKVFLDPTTEGQKQVTLTIAGYDNNRVPLPTQSTVASGTSNVIIGDDVPVPLPTIMTVGQTAPFTVFFGNFGTATATGASVSSSVANFHTNCITELFPGFSCEASGTFTPTSATPSSQSVKVTYSFAQGDPVEVTLTTTVSDNGLSGKVTQGLPALTEINTNYDVSFKFKNNSSNAVMVTRVDPFTTPTTNFVLNTTTTTCCTGLTGCTTTPDLFSLPAGTSCVIAGTLNWLDPPTTPPASLVILAAGLVVSSPPPADVAVETSTTVQTAITSERELVFVNNCNFKVWFSLNGGAIKGSPVCDFDTQCPAGTRCNASAHLCFWDNYSPTSGVLELFANGGSETVKVPEPPVTGNPDPTTYWSGAVSASTGCNLTSSCETAACNNAGGSIACPPGVGFNQPATQAEFTLKKTIVDSYDIEVINGFHIPIEMAPNDPSGVSNYTCGSPGKEIVHNNFGACNWNNAVVPNDELYWVSSGGAACNTDATCGNQICGVSRVGNNFSKTCGKFLGFWTANEVCGSNPVFTETSVKDFFNCDAFLGSPFPPNTFQMTQLYGCSGIPTCYDSGATTSCCGCADWQTLSITPAINLPPAPTTENCVAKDPIWVDNVQPKLTWMKQACPMTYTYPFDDKSSSFTCIKGNPNTQDYIITFCPGSFTGLPAGKLDGRNG